MDVIILPLANALTFFNAEGTIPGPESPKVDAFAGPAQAVLQSTLEAILKQKPGIRRPVPAGLRVHRPLGLHRQHQRHGSVCPVIHSG